MRSSMWSARRDEAAAEATQAVTARSSGSPCPPSSPSSPSRSSCSPTRSSSATSAPSSSPRSASPPPPCDRRELFVFLAYGTTGAVARRLGAGDHRWAPLATRRRRAVARAVVLGLAAGLVALLAGRRAPGRGWLGAPPARSRSRATTYLRISALGVPAMLLNLAATGVLRGLQDTRTPLVVALVGFPANIVLNVTLVLRRGPGHRRLGLGHGARPARHGRGADVGRGPPRAPRRRLARLRPADPGAARGRARRLPAASSAPSSLRGVLLSRPGSRPAWA